MKRLSYANVMASAAVFIALGGTSFAAMKITGKDIRNGSVTSKDVRNNSLKGKDVRTGSIRGSDLRDGTITSADMQSNARWLLLDENGAIAEQSGGFTVVSKPGTNGQPATNPNIYVNAGESLVGKGLGATLAIQNKIDRSGDMMADPAFAGDVAVGRCNTTAIMCVPTGTNQDNVLVVRALADNGTASSQTRRVYVHVTP